MQGAKLTDWTAYVAAAISGLFAFMATNIEPQAGVWLAALGGSLVSMMTGQDRGLLRMIAHVVSGMAVGLAISQLTVEFISLKSGYTRVWIAFFAALFSEKIIVLLDEAMTARGIAAMFDRLLPWRKR